MPLAVKSLAAHIGDGNPDAWRAALRVFELAYSKPGETVELDTETLDPLRVAEMTPAERGVLLARVLEEHPHFGRAGARALACDYGVEQLVRLLKGAGAVMPPPCETALMSEAPVRSSKNGLVVDGEGWFVVNARDSRWKDEGPLGSYCTFEGKRRFPHFGINISVLEPGERLGMYHREQGQEAFLVLAGECTLIVEGQERPLVAWDFFYCAPETEHIIVAAGEQSAIVLAVGARGRGVGGGIVYTVSKAAARYGASVLRETTEPAIAYAKIWAGLPRSRFVKYRPGWLPKSD